MHHCVKALLVGGAVGYYLGSRPNSQAVAEIKQAGTMAAAGAQRLVSLVRRPSADDPIGAPRVHHAATSDSGRRLKPVRVPPAHAMTTDTTVTVSTEAAQSQRETS